MIPLGLEDLSSRSLADFEKCLNTRLNINEGDFDTGKTLLHLISETCQLDKLKVLVKLFPALNVNVRDAMGATPLYLASRVGASDVVHFLLSLPNVDPHIATTMGLTPLFIACARGHEGIVRDLLASEKPLGLDLLVQGRNIKGVARGIMEATILEYIKGPKEFRERISNSKNLQV